MQIKRSYCPACKHILAARDLLPVISYIALKGRCRYCSESIPASCLTSEIVSGLFFGLTFLYMGFNVYLVRLWCLYGVLAAVSRIDLASGIIPDGLIAAGMALRLFFLPLTDGSVYESLISSIAAALLMSFGVLSISLVTGFIRKKDVLGGGDIKLFFMTGLYTGLWQGIVGLMIASFTALIYMLIKRRKKISFGPFISFGVMVMMVFGPTVMRVYLSLLFSIST